MNGAKSAVRKLGHFRRNLPSSALAPWFCVMNESSDYVFVIDRTYAAPEIAARSQVIGR
jgi:hypothetical protein